MNDQIFFILYNLAHKSVFFDNLVVFTAKFFPYIVILSAKAFLLFHHEIFSSPKLFKAFKQKWKEIVLVFFSGVFAWFLAFVLKLLIHSLRPVAVFPQISSLLSANGYAFPSGHATFYMALAVAIFFYHKKTGYLFMFFALLISLARIIAGVHFPIDILGGFVLGIVTAYLVRFLYSKIVR